MPKKKAGRKVTNADLFAPVEREQLGKQPRPAPQGAEPPRGQIQVPKEGQFNVKVRPDMAPPGVPQQTMLPISAGPGAPPVAMVPIAFVLPQGAQPGMEIKVPFKVIGPPQTLPLQTQPQPQPHRPSAVPSPAPPPSSVATPEPEPEPEPPVSPPSEVTAVLAKDEGEVRITWIPPMLPGQELNDGKVMPETPAPCRVEYRGAVWPPDAPQAASKPTSPAAKKGSKSQKGQKKQKSDSSDDVYRALPASTLLLQRRRMPGPAVEHELSAHV
eukprot:COSAG02_NODE_1167_length_14137_cov_25.567175_7_plen_271_part_00